MADDAYPLIQEALDALATTVGPAADDSVLLSALTLVEGATRRLDHIAVTALAELERRGTFTARGYRSEVPRCSRT